MEIISQARCLTGKMSHRQDACATMNADELMSNFLDCIILYNIIMILVKISGK